MLAAGPVVAPDCVASMPRSAVSSGDDLPRDVTSAGCFTNCGDPWHCHSVELYHLDGVERSDNAVDDGKPAVQ